MKPQSTGFTLIELTVVLVVASLLFAISAPSFSKLSDNVTYREAVHDVVKALHTAKKRALHRNVPVDVVLEAPERKLSIVNAGELPGSGALIELPDSLEMTVTTAADVSAGQGLQVIRFYPMGGSTGGDITLLRDTGVGTLIQVGWLLADVKQSPVP